MHSKTIQIIRNICKASFAPPIGYIWNINKVFVEDFLCLFFQILVYLLIERDFVVYRL